jgi:hypothetical protein
MQEVNRGHFHEIMDRCHIVLSMIDDFILEHPGMTETMNDFAKDAQHQLSTISQLAITEEEAFIKK